MKRIFFLILLAVMSTGIYAQTDDKGYKEADRMGLEMGDRFQ